MLANEAATKRRDKVFMAERVRLGKRKFQAQRDKTQTHQGATRHQHQADVTHAFSSPGLKATLSPSDGERDRVRGFSGAVLVWELLVFESWSLFGIWIWILDFCKRFALARVAWTRYRVDRVRNLRHFGYHRRQSLVAAAFRQTGARPGRQTARGGGV